MFSVTYENSNLELGCTASPESYLKVPFGDANEISWFNG